MIGYYIHHQGMGHLHRAAILANALSEDCVGLSSAEKPQGWRGRWVKLPLDTTDDLPSSRTAHDVTAAGNLHWAPLRHHGLRERMSMISAWIARNAPDLFVVDVSVEVSMLARLHGVPILTIALPGDRDDPVHRFGYSVSAAVVGFWPPQVTSEIHQSEAAHRVVALGGLSRFEPLSQSRSKPVPPRSIVILNGRGGGSAPDAAAQSIAQAFPEAKVSILGGTSQAWVPHPWPALSSADVVVTSAGQNSIAEVAASRTPAVLFPQSRPFGEQQSMATALIEGMWPALAAPQENTVEAWHTVLTRATGLDGMDWVDWCDGHAATRFNAVAEEVRLRVLSSTSTRVETHVN